MKNHKKTREYLIWGLMGSVGPCLLKNQQTGKIKSSAIWGSWACSTTSEIHESADLSGLPKMNPEKYESKMKQNSSTELSGYSFNNIYNGNGPKTH